MYCLRRILGEGGYGIIYLAESATDGKIKALKIEKNALPWEFYILKTIELRCSGSRELDSLVRCERAYAFDDEVYLLLDYHPQGTVLDMFNLIQSDPMAQGVEECFVLFLAVELLRVVESLHKAGIIHCDLKPDNVMLRLERISNDAAWSKYYSQDGSNKWAHKGIALIDFGRAIDMTLLRPDVQFVADWVMDELDCIEMQENRKWTYQADYYGIASVLHLLLFDRDISVAKSADGSYKLTSPFKRYWQKDLWAELFDALLNSAAYGQLPITSMLTECRRKIEKRLEDNAMPLKESIQRIEELISRRNTH
ncbi:hypothetical protein TRVA0_011S02058 [Trichomonascus vanleenenianus]|uniref:protein kinase BUB1 n=1 Tax=Trichomonascus vanleenenianus TaxID=2268995 RepID=UPI003ECA86D0